MTAKIQVFGHSNLINKVIVKVNTFDQLVPGYAIFFALFGVNAAAGTILQEKEDGTFSRLLIAPVHKYALLGGNWWRVVAAFHRASMDAANS
jgi:hypothetical protein